MKNGSDVIRAKDAKSNFGKAGWMIILLGLVMYFMSAGVIVEGSNVIYPAYAASTGISEASLYAIATVANLMAIPLSVLVGIGLTKLGARKMLFACWLGGALGLLLMGATENFAVYCLARILLCNASSGGITMAYNGLIANWFPTKKDLVQGYATIGSNLSTAFAVAILTLMISSFQVGGAFYICAGAFLVIAVVSLVFVRDNPEDVGLYPDNDQSMTREKAQALFEVGESYRKSSPWTISKLLRTKQVWQISIGYGIILLITVGILSTFISTLAIKGLELNAAIAMMTVAAVVAMPCSCLWGFLGTKLGTKKATLLLYAIVFLCILSMLIPGVWTAYVAVALLGCFIGAGNNLTPSIIGSVFGRYDFSRALTVIIPIWNIVVAFATSIVGVPQALTNSYVASYVVLAVLAVLGFILVITLDERCVGRTDLIESNKN